MWHFLMRSAISMQMPDRSCCASCGLLVTPEQRQSMYKVCFAQLQTESRTKLTARYSAHSTMHVSVLKEPALPSHLSDHSSCSCLLSKANLAHSLGGLWLERSILNGPGMLELAPALLHLLALLSVLQTSLTVHLGDLIRALSILKAVRTRWGSAQAPAAAGASRVQNLTNQARREPSG